jgi:hypothetical protein
MAKIKGGRKLVRSGKHAGMYAAQFLRTARNKHNRIARIARRKVEIPQK